MSFLAFQPEQYRTDFADATKELVASLSANQEDAAKTAIEMITAMRRNIDVMERVDVDQQSAAAKSLAEAEITEIGEYALTLLDELSIVAANRGMQQVMLLLHRLSLPVALWIEKHHGKTNKLDIVVNAIATYANTVSDSESLAELSSVIEKVTHSVADDIKKDLEASNPARPWRVLNLNWGIVATRSHNAELMSHVFDQLIKNIPVDAKSFFQEGMQQMDIVGYPDHVREVMEKYSKLWGVDVDLH